MEREAKARPASVSIVPPHGDRTVAAGEPPPLATPSGHASPDRPDHPIGTSQRIAPVSRRHGCRARQARGAARGRRLESCRVRQHGQDEGVHRGGPAAGQHTRRHRVRTPYDPDPERDLRSRPRCIHPSSSFVLFQAADLHRQAPTQTLPRTHTSPPPAPRVPHFTSLTNAYPSTRTGSCPCSGRRSTTESRLQPTSSNEAPR